LKWLKRILLALVALLGVCLVALLIAYFAAAGEYRVPATVAKDTSLPRLTVKGVTYHGEIHGPKDAPVVIVIHGGPGNDYRYLLPLKPLADTYRVVFYDQRGTGLSPRVPREELTLNNMIEDLANIAKHFGKGQKARLIGHSWGAMLASAVAGRYPKLFSHIVLAEPGLLTTEAAKAFMKKFRFMPGLKSGLSLIWLWLQSRHVKGPDKWAKNDLFFASLTGLDAPENPLKGYACNGDKKTMHIPMWRYGMDASMEIQGKAMGGKTISINLVKGIEQYKGKTLFVTGSCNKLIGAPHQKRYHMKFFPGATLKVIKDAGHTMFGEKPKVTLKILRDFLKSNPK
tara:strand:+ start:1170 stop:2195 length:1026 start_codon:yes stop_codon:yes gene_type:complete